MESKVEQYLPTSVHSFSVSNFQGIKDAELSDLPADARWILLTGENGYGKTSILRAITIALYGRLDPMEGSRELGPESMKVELKVNLNNQKGEEILIRTVTEKDGDGISFEVPVVAYGPVRIPSGKSSNVSGSNVKSLFSSDGDLFHNVESELVNLFRDEEVSYEKSKSTVLNTFSTVILFGLDEYPEIKDACKGIKDELEGDAFFEQFLSITSKVDAILDSSDMDVILLEKYKRGFKALEKVVQESIAKIGRSKYPELKSFLLNVMDNIEDIVIQDNKVQYIETEDPHNPKVIEQLASGNRMILTWIGDMLIRLDFFSVDKMENIYGVVVIDEFDLHLHPKWQKRLPQILSDQFPNIQFIASTHSPVALLGAPEHSVFLSVKRTEEEGITVHRWDDKFDIQKMLPNAILNSPMFDLDDILSSSVNSDEVMTQDDFKEAIYHEVLERKMQEYIDNQQS
ncbi:AAA family ATPase [Halosquirtibacter xylanolyticus]|uniref:AAA family ATPase n=1 Tax=Halosquirtibacter xylanolyticus TaxID=3374599 RepID=UPI0037490F01|nr:AAA family ATPase [Prolixibacteraceae bacterium]